MKIKSFATVFAILLAALCTQSCFGLFDDSDSGSPKGAVDLGLSVYWADCNLGASSPSQAGSFYAWGEVKPKTNFKWNNYKWTKEEKSSYGDPILLRSKYNCNSNLGTVDNKLQLDPEDDAASVKLGGKWRMPTHKEMQELLNNCTWTWSEKDGVKGFEVKNESTGKSIFLPAVGYYGPGGGSLNPTGGDIREVGKEANYWTSSMLKDGGVPGLHIARNYHDIWSIGRDCGCVIRPVRDK